MTNYRNMKVCTTKRHGGMEGDYARNIDRVLVVKGYTGGIVKGRRKDRYSRTTK